MNNENPQGDLISRDALLKAIKENKELYERERVYLEGLILNAPKAEAKPEDADALQYSKGYNDGFIEAKKLFIDPENAAVLEKITAEIVSILKDVMPQVVEYAKERATE